MNNTRKSTLQCLLDLKKKSIEAVMRDLATSQTQEHQMKLETRLEQLLQEAEDLEEKLLIYSQSKQEEYWDENLYKINYKQAITQIKQVLESFQGGTGAALFLIKGYDSYCGNYCISHLNNLLKDCGIVKKIHPTGFPTTPPPAPEDLIKKLGGQELYSTLDENMIHLIDELYNSLRGNNILFITINLDYAKPDHTFLNWLVQVFWSKLINYQLPNQKRVKVVGLVTVNEGIADDLFSHLCCNDQDEISQNHFLPLIQEKWKVEEVYKWLCDFSFLDKDDGELIAMANSIALSENADEELRYPKDSKVRLLQDLEKSLSLT
jgi:inactive STAND